MFVARAMQPQWIVKGVQFAVRFTALFGYICLARNHYGTISVVGPAFVNREVTLKAGPLFPWGCDVEWKYRIEGDTQFQTMNGPNVKMYSEDGSFFLKCITSIEYNRSDFYAGCTTNTTIRSRLISLNVKDIVGLCGALETLSPVDRGANVKLGYFPSDHSIQHKTYTNRTWRKDMKDIILREGSFEEEMNSEYVYVLNIFNFDEKDEGTYFLNCNSVGSLGKNTDSVKVFIPVPPSYPVLGPTFADFNTSKCIYVYGDSDIYCKTENGTKPVLIELLLGQDSFVLAESKWNKGMYLFRNVYQQMNVLARRNVTCRVSNEALERPYEVHGILCRVEEGSPPVLTVPEYFDGDSSTITCEVHNAIPAPAIQIHVGKSLLSDIQQTDSLNRSSHTFTSTAKVTKTNKLWNGKEMCCTRKSIDDFGIADHSICKNISIKCNPTLYLNTTSPVNLPPNTTLVVKCTVLDDCSDNGKYTFWWKDENDTVIKICNKSDECLLTLNNGDGEWICFGKSLNAETSKTLNVPISVTKGSQSHEKDIQTFFSTFRFPVNNVLIGTAVFCGFCILFAIGRCIFLKRRKDNAVNTIEIVEIRSDTSSDNGVLHMETEGVQYAVVQRQAASQGIEMQQPRDDDGLAYAELDIKFLLEANARVPARRTNTPTEYADIAFARSKNKK